MPSKGAAATVQGEVIRVSGRLHHELEANGGMNWDSDFVAMAFWFAQAMHRGHPLDDADLLVVDADLLVAAQEVDEVKRKRGDTVGLCRYAMEWSLGTENRLDLSEVRYRR